MHLRTESRKEAIHHPDNFNLHSNIINYNFTSIIVVACLIAADSINISINYFPLEQSEPVMQSSNSTDVRVPMQINHITAYI